MNPLSEEEYSYKLDNMVLISSEHLRSLFQERWKKESGKDWEHSENQGQEFIQGLGQGAYNNAMNTQKGIIAGGKLDDWDISVLSVVLLNFGDLHTYRSVNMAVRQLANLQNELAHHPSKKLTLDEYNVKVDSFRSIMKELGVSDEEIEQVIENSGCSSSVEALKSTKRLYDRAMRLLKENKFEHAIECYEEAITMPSLLPIHQATTYEKRADCRIKFALFKQGKGLNSEVDYCCNLALLDADRALEVNPKSWKALLWKAQAHRLKRDFEKAIEFCRQSLSMSPGEREVQNELANCNDLLTIEKGDMDYVKARKLPKSMDDILEEYSKGYGITVTEKMFHEIGSADKTPGQEFDFRGRQYQYGWGVPQNEVKAAQYFTKGAELGFAEAIHSLGYCYYSGQGVKQDVSKAFELFQKAAQMSATSPGGETITGSNVGVASAQHDLGIMYQLGVPVEEDHVQAAKWFGKAAENGDGRAAIIMGDVYMSGRGVPGNVKLAEYQWLQAVRFGEATAANDLVMLYKLHLEPEKALQMFKTGREMGSQELVSLSEEEFMFEIREIVKNRDVLKPGLVSFEKQHKLETKGWTFLSRFHRKHDILDGIPSSSKAKIQSKPQGDDWQLRFADSENIKKWKTAAEKGSIVAAGLLKALEASCRVMDLVYDRQCFNNEKALELLNALYDRLNSDYHNKLKDVQQRSLPSIKKAVEDLFKSQHGKKGDVEMKARLCFVEYNLKLATGKNIARGIELLQEGISMYPDNVNYYIMLARLHMKVNDFKSCFAVLKNGLEKFPDNVQLLFLNVSLLKNRKSNTTEQVIGVYNEFLSKAPKDDPNLRVVYFEIANFYLSIMQHNCQVLLEKIATYYKQGKEAEERTRSLGISTNSYDGVKENLESFLGLKVEEKVVKPVSTILLQEQVERVLHRKPYLENPVRKRIILWQREMTDRTITDEIAKPNLIQSAPKKLFQLKSTNLSDMSSRTDVIYQNCFIDLTIIDEPNFNLAWVQLVAEDENGDAVFVFIHQLEPSKINFERLQFGRRIRILNPYMQIGPFEIERGIRIDDQDCLLFMGGLRDMCRFCGDQNATRKCGNCKKARYCSKECQEYDWKFLKHKRVCSHIKNGKV